MQITSPHTKILNLMTLPFGGDLEGLKPPLTPPKEGNKGYGIWKFSSLNVEM
jgi:hypothetical protein